MIVILNGSLGVGKTSLSWALNEAVAYSVMLDGDYLAALHPFSYQKEADLDYLFRTMAHLIQFHQRNGFRYFFLNYVFEDNNQLAMLVNRMRSLDDCIHCFYLTCAPAVQLERIKRRQNTQVDWELTRALALNDILTEASQSGFIGESLDTTNLSIKEIVDIVLERLKVK